MEVWHPVVLASLPSQCLDIPQHREPREVYLETLFAPEFFCPATLQKGEDYLVQTLGFDGCVQHRRDVVVTDASCRLD